MRRDLILALVFSLLLHGGLAGFGELLKKPATRVVRVSEPPAPVFVMPPLDPDPPEMVDKPEDIPLAADFSPPVLPDAPQPPQPESFLQPLEPPQPDNVRPSTALAIIPPGRLGARTIAEIFDSNALDQPPLPTYQAKPVYPFEQRRGGITGDVVVGFIVDATGSVQNAYAISSTQHDFEASAVQAVLRWKFKPGRKGGRAVNTRMQVPIVFNINNDTN